jgi:hypothetical protein
MPSGPQDKLMTSLCAELHLNKASVVAGLDNHDSYSAKLTQLSLQKQEQRAAQGDKVRRGCNVQPEQRDHGEAFWLWVICAWCSTHCAGNC